MMPPMVYMIPPASSQPKALGGSAWTSRWKAVTQAQPMEMYMMEENHLGHVIQSALITMPMMAMIHTASRRVRPVRSPRTSTQTGV